VPPPLARGGFFTCSFRRANASPGKGRCRGIRRGGEVFKSRLCCAFSCLPLHRGRLFAYYFRQAKFLSRAYTPGCIMVGRNWDTTKISLKIGKTFAFSKKNQEIVVNLTNCQLLTGGGYNKRGYPYRYFQNTPRCTAAVRWRQAGRARVGGWWAAVCRISGGPRTTSARAPYRRTAPHCHTGGAAHRHTGTTPIPRANAHERTGTNPIPAPTRANAKAQSTTPIPRADAHERAGTNPIPDAAAHQYPPRPAHVTKKGR
jgi:hypothetical protein